MLLPYPDLRCICRYLDLDSAKVLATALVSSRLDYCNLLLLGIGDADLTKLQRVRNQLARVFDKVTSIYLQYFTASFPSSFTTKIQSCVPDLFADQQNSL